ncbi:MAG: Y-family DNA polymerase [Erysipelothrix sp.]|nr:Y-family DNA polymerase [Erysipelothrix sp.]
MNRNLKFDYDKEPSRDILCLDCKSFYASCEAVALGYDPLKVKLVVMSYPSDSPQKRGSGLILASSPQAKKAYNISNVSRARDLPYPYPDDLVIVAPRMNLYMEVNKTINNIYRTFVSDEDIAVYSVDETFLDVTNSLAYFDCDTAYDLAKMIQTKVFNETGIYTTVGIGDNPLLAKLALDNESKLNQDMKAEWRYEDVKTKLWSIPKLTDFWGIGAKTEIRLRKLGIKSIYELSQYNYYELKDKMGVIGAQLFAHSWGIDRTFLGEVYTPKSKSIGNSQVLPKDYTKQSEIEIIIREIADQVATKLRRDGLYTQSISLWIGYSLNFIDEEGKTGFSKQIKITNTNNTKIIAKHLIQLFRQHYYGQSVRNIGVSTTKLNDEGHQQLSLFDNVETVEINEDIDKVVDKVRSRFGFSKLIYLSSKQEGARALERSKLVGGHAGGMIGLENKESKKKN